MKYNSNIFSKILIYFTDAKICNQITVFYTELIVLKEKVAQLSIKININLNID